MFSPPTVEETLVIETSPGLAGYKGDVPTVGANGFTQRGARKKPAWAKPVAGFLPAVRSDQAIDIGNG